jgi:hypothetical protein
MDRGKLLLAGGSFCDPAELGQNVFLAEDQILLVIDGDVIAGVFAEQDPIAPLHVERDAFTLVDLAGPDGDHLTFLRPLFGSVGNDDAAFRGFLLFESPYQNAVM